MAVSLKEAQDGDLGEVSEINVTPFIDVILVLLIIFMVAAPLSTVDVAVDLPVSNAQPQPRPDKPVFLTSRVIFRWRWATTPCRAKACNPCSTSARPTTVSSASSCAPTARSPIAT
jgi:hypothetical protein